MSAVDQTFAALSDPTRRRVVELLKSGPRRAGELADELDASRPAMSRHLRVLRQSGLVEVMAGSLEDDARARSYRLCAEPFDELRSWVDDVEAYWAGQLAAFKGHAERRRGGKRK